MNKKSLRRVVGILTVCFAAVLASVNHNVSYENRIPSWIIIGLFTIGGWTLFSGRKPRIEGQERQAVEQNILRLDRQAKWVAVGILAVGLIGIVVVCVSDTPTATRANKIDFVSLQQQRDLSTPSSRLVGHWEGDGTLYYRPIDRSLGYGTYTWGNVPVQFKVLSESRSGTYLRTREFLKLDSGAHCANVEYCIPKDGQSMTKEIVFNDGSQGLFKYSYVDDSTHVDSFGGYKPIYESR